MRIKEKEGIAQGRPAPPMPEGLVLTVKVTTDGHIGIATQGQVWLSPDEALSHAALIERLVEAYRGTGS